jgi:hypothetical protein
MVKTVVISIFIANTARMLIGCSNLQLFFFHVTACREHEYGDI